MTSLVAAGFGVTWIANLAVDGCAAADGLKCSDAGWGLLLAWGIGAALLTALVLSLLVRLAIRRRRHA